MKNFTKLLVLLGIVFAVLLGCQIVVFFGIQLGLGILSLLFMGSIALSLVMSGNNNSQEDLFMEDFMEDFREN